MLDLDVLEPVFGSADIRFLTDSPDIALWLGANGVDADDTNRSGDRRPENVVLALTRWDGDVPLRQMQQLGDSLAESRVLTLPIGAFDTSLDAARYTIERALSCDFATACAGCEVWAKEFADLGLDEPLHFTGPHTDVRVELGGRLAIGSRLEPRLEPGERISALNYFEFGVESVGTGRADFSVSGTLEVAGMLAARNSTLPAEVLPRWRTAESLVRALFEQGNPGIQLDVEHNQVRSIRVGGREMVTVFAELTNAVYETKVLEFSIGTNRSIAGRADWSINSLINEGHAGIHVGIGDGTTGPHIDFVCTNVDYAKPGFI